MSRRSSHRLLRRRGSARPVFRPRLRGRSGSSSSQHLVDALKDERLYAVTATYRRTRPTTSLSSGATRASSTRRSCRRATRRRRPRACPACPPSRWATTSSARSSSCAALPVRQRRHARRILTNDETDWARSGSSNGRAAAPADESVPPVPPYRWTRDNRILLATGLAVGAALAGGYALVLRTRDLTAGRDEPGSASSSSLHRRRPHPRPPLRPRAQRHQARPRAAPRRLRLPIPRPRRRRVRGSRAPADLAPHPPDDGPPAEERRALVRAARREHDRGARVADLVRRAQRRAPNETATDSRLPRGARRTGTSSRFFGRARGVGVSTTSNGGGLRGRLVAVSSPRWPVRRSPTPVSMAADARRARSRAHEATRDG